MAKRKSTLKAPIVRGVQFLTVNEAALLTGLSTWRLRERASERDTRRGGFIRSHLIGGHRYFHPDELKSDLYGQQSTAITFSNGNGNDKRETEEDDDCPV